MNFEDEPYVRLYVTDTVTWEMLEFEGQTLLLHMLKGKFDRAGIFEFGKHDPVRAIKARLKNVPVDLIRTGLERLISEDVWELHEGCLVWVRYIEAQTAKRSSSARKKDERERRKAEKRAQELGVTQRDTCDHELSDTPENPPREGEPPRHAESHDRTQRDAPNTQRDPSSRDVTDSHVQSHGVTSCHSEAEAEAESPPSPPQGGDDDVGGGRVPCPKSLRLTKDQREMAGMQGTSQQAIDAITARYVGNYLGKPDERRTLEQWRSGLNTMVHREGRNTTLHLRQESRNGASTDGSISAEDFAGGLRPE